MKVSVIICTYSTERLQDTITAVNSLLVQSYPNVEIIISVDHNEELFEILKEQFSKRVYLAFNYSVRGLSDTRNAGVLKATGDIIAFMDDDGVADRNWVKTLVSNYESPDAIAVGGKLVPVWEKERPWWFPEELDWIVGCTYKGHPQEKTEVRNLIGCNMSFRREVFDYVGYFKPDIGRLGKVPLGGEEMEYCIRVQNAFPKGKIIYEPEAIVYHKVAKHRESINYIIKRSYGEGISKSFIRQAANMSISLSSENKYLKFLLFKSIPYYLGKSILLESPLHNVSKALMISLAIASTGLGYIRRK